LKLERWCAGTPLDAVDERHPRKQGLKHRRSGVIVFDHRDRATAKDGSFIGNKEAYSGHDLYYRRDYSDHRIGGMYKVQSATELKSLMSKSDSELASMMKSDPKRWKGVISKKATA
jgi:hypothetical protein